MPKRKDDAIWVVDVESTCWEGNPPPGEVSEIVEIGMALLSIPTLEIVDHLDILLTPQESNISPFCTQLTGITEAVVRARPSFAMACRVLTGEGLHQAEPLATRERIWASYGDYDRQQFERQCARQHVPYPFGPRHLNIKTFLMLAYGWPKEKGMAEALEKLGLPLKGTHHRAGHDALNIAKLLALALQDARSGALLRKDDKGIG